MGYRGFIRACAAQARAAERERIREHKRLERERILQAREEMIEAAEEAVESYEEYLKTITSLHKSAQEAMDWEDLKGMPDPDEPKISRRVSDSMLMERAAYRPSLLDRILFRAERIREHYDIAIHHQKAKEAKEHLAAHQKWEEECKQAIIMRDIARRILAKDAVAWKEAMEKYLPLEDLGIIASSAKATWDDFETVSAVLTIRDNECIPDYVLSQTAKGLLSKKAMAKKRYWELYEDLVISAAIRAARELFAILPFSLAKITCEATRASQETGQDETGPILFVEYPREKFLALNFDRIDPSESLKSFRHRVAFKRGQGFTFVDLT